jgi:hypothetical protein
VQVPHHGDDHHPARLTRVLALVCVAFAATPAANAAAPKYVALPSPFAPLSASPPLSGGAASSAEGVRHRIAATTSVRISVDATGKPFAVRATQRLDVRVQGDYFFTIGAPALSATTAAGSASAPGLRVSSLVWAGFDPGRRTLAASIVLEPGQASAALPLRIEVARGQVTLVNTTAIAVNGFTAAVRAAPLARYARQLARELSAGRAPTPGGALVTSTPRPTAFRAVAFLHVFGTVGDRRVDLQLGAAPVGIPGGKIRLTAEPVAPSRLLHPAPTVSGRALLRRVTTVLLDLARSHQYDTYLGNPDPVGSNETTYLYRSAARPAPVAVPAPAARKSGVLRTLLVVAGLVAALALGVVAWSRS